MIFNNIDFHNVEEIELCNKGYIMWRVPKFVREKLNERAKEEVSRYSTGVELRFKMKGDSADLYFCSETEEEAQVAYIYFGSFQGGWMQSSKIIGTDKTKITINRPQNLDKLKEVARDEKMPFNPEVIRIVLPYGRCYFLGAEGEFEPPSETDVPQRTYLAYGSSITHGSLALAPVYSYPFRIAQKLDCDFFNLGFAGTAQLEKEMAEYIVSRKDWEFASFEMGVNMLPYFDENNFEKRVADFTKVLASDSRPIFITSIFDADKDINKMENFRSIVKSYSSDKFIFTDGYDLLHGLRYVSQDMVHPTIEGMERIVNNWSEIMNKNLKNARIL